MPSAVFLHARPAGREWFHTTRGRETGPWVELPRALAVLAKDGGA